MFFRTRTANRVAILRQVAALKGAGLFGITKAGITTDCDADHATIDDDLVARAGGAP